MSEECWKKVVGHVLDMRQRYGEDGLTTDERGIRWAEQRIAELEAKLAELGRLEPDGYDTAMRHDYVYLSTIKSVLGKRRRLT